MSGAVKQACSKSVEEMPMPMKPLLMGSLAVMALIGPAGADTAVAVAPDASPAAS